MWNHKILSGGKGTWLATATLNNGTIPAGGNIDTDGTYTYETLTNDTTGIHRIIKRDYTTGAIVLQRNFSGASTPTNAFLKNGMYYVTAKRIVVNSQFHSITLEISPSTLSVVSNTPVLGTGDSPVYGTPNFNVSNLTYSGVWTFSATNQYSKKMQFVRKLNPSPGYSNYGAILSDTAYDVYPNRNIYYDTSTNKTYVATSFRSAGSRFGCQISGFSSDLQHSTSLAAIIYRIDNSSSATADYIADHSATDLYVVGGGIIEGDSVGGDLIYIIPKSTMICSKILQLGTTKGPVRIHSIKFSGSDCYLTGEVTYTAVNHNYKFRSKVNLSTNTVSYFNMMGTSYYNYGYGYTAGDVDSNNKSTLITGVVQTVSGYSSFVFKHDADKAFIGTAGGFTFTSETASLTNVTSNYACSNGWQFTISDNNPGNYTEPYSYSMEGTGPFTDASHLVY